MHTVATVKTHAWHQFASGPASFIRHEKPETETVGSAQNSAAVPRWDKDSLLQWLPAQALHCTFLRGAVYPENGEGALRRVI